MDPPREAGPLRFVRVTGRVLGQWNQLRWGQVAANALVPRLAGSVTWDVEIVGIASFEGKDRVWFRKYNINKKKGTVLFLQDSARSASSWIPVMRETSVSLPNQKIRQKAKSENFSLYLLVSHRTDLVLFRFAI